MWQVVRDTRDGLMEANLFTDEWPNYTTVISQELAPRISEVGRGDSIIIIVVLPVEFNLDCRPLSGAYNIIPSSQEIGVVCMS
jgi:hypothetical protein